MFLHLRIGQHQFFDACTIGIFGDAQIAAQLAVDLQHQLDFIDFQCCGIGLRPRRLQDIFAIAEFAPQIVSDVWRDRR